jgi:4-amino-4-deoxy-L-arabinose transferase-like glycosyltransferase
MATELLSRPEADPAEKEPAQPSPLGPMPRPEALFAVVMLLAVPMIFAGIPFYGFADNEGRYAEVAREMLLGGDWITPHLNGELFLNKPPLLYWLTALFFKAFGFTETARAVAGVATLLTLPLLFDLGRRLRSPAAGAWAALIYLTSTMTPVEARMLRPDGWVTLLICLSLWGAVRVVQRPSEDPVGVAAFWGGIGLGILAKGFLALILPFLALLPALALARELRLLRRLTRWWGPALMLLIALPWHVAAGLRNEGFWWDFIVNQHLMAFLGKKTPPDHAPHPLWFVWTSLAVRFFPWVVLMPAAVSLAIRRSPEADVESHPLRLLPLTWLLAVVAFFSLTNGRMEHYFLPAVPAGALLLGSLAAHWSTPESIGGRTRTWRSLPFLALALVGIAGLVFVGRLGKADFVAPAPSLLPMAKYAVLAVAALGLTALAMAAAGRPGWALGTLGMGFLFFSPLVGRGLAIAEVFTSPRPLIAKISPALLQQSESVYEAGQEYQLCGAVNFYTGRRLLLQEPPEGYVPPTYLRYRRHAMFLTREALDTRWRDGTQRYLFFTDPERDPDRPSDVPQPRYLVAESGRRQVWTNLPAPFTPASPAP